VFLPFRGLLSRVIKRDKKQLKAIKLHTFSLNNDVYRMGSALNLSDNYNIREWVQGVRCAKMHEGVKGCKLQGWCMYAKRWVSARAQWHNSDGGGVQRY